VSRERASRGPRRLAEWVSFGVSLALVLGVVAHLVWRLREPVTERVSARVTAQLDRVTEQSGRFVLPIAIENPGGRTVRDLQVRIEYRGDRGATESMELLIDYIGQASEQVVYTYFRRDPRTLSIRAEPISYQVD
jgi:uncharacterized protein (TIGR02588 family)